MLEFCQAPELFSGKNSADEVGNIVPYLIVCHCSDYDVMRMRSSVPAGYDEVKALLRHLIEVQNVQIRIGRIFIRSDDRCIKVVTSVPLVLDSVHTIDFFCIDAILSI